MTKVRKAKRGYTGPRVKDTETFVLKSLWQHGDRYDYSRVEYTGAYNKVDILCQEHGSFYVTPHNHANGASGCPKCKGEGNRERWLLNTNIFIEKSRKVHGDRYDYSKVEYVDGRTPVTIICKEHGEFLQQPANHADSGAGCQECAGFNHRRSTTSEFIKKARGVHGDKYSYEKVVYATAQEPVEITCPEHGAFFQKAFHHLSGRGCRPCSIRSRAEFHRYTLDEFVSLANGVHEGKYDYSRALYIDSRTPVEIICPEHGAFHKTPHLHLVQEVGCPECSLRDRGWGASGYYGTDSPSNLYVLLINDEFIKVGLSKNISSRMRQISSETGYPVEKITSISGKANELFKLEQEIVYYSGFSKFNHENKFNGHTECFDVSVLEEILEILHNYSNMTERTEQCMSA